MYLRLVLFYIEEVALRVNYVRILNILMPRRYVQGPYPNVFVALHHWFEERLMDFCAESLLTQVRKIATELS